MMCSELGPAFTRLRTAPAGFYGSLLTCPPDKTRRRSMRLQKEVQGTNTHQHDKALLENIKSTHLSVPHLDEGVQSLSIRLQELCFNVQHVDLCPGNHCSDKNTIRGAQPLRTHTDSQHTGSHCWISLPVPLAIMEYSPSSICTVVLQRTPACSECISLQGNKGVTVSALQDKRLPRFYEGAETHLRPERRPPESRTSPSWCCPQSLFRRSFDIHQTLKEEAA